MIIKVCYQTAGPYNSVEKMLEACGRVELPTSQFYQEQEKITIEITQGVKIIITDHFGPVPWLYPSKDIPSFDEEISITISQNDEVLSFPRNNADCYGVSENDILKVTITHKGKTTSHKVTFSKLQP